MNYEALQDKLRSIKKRIERVSNASDNYKDKNPEYYRGFTNAMKDMRDRLKENELWDGNQQ